MNASIPLRLRADSASSIIAAPMQVFLDETLASSLAANDLGVRVAVFDRDAVLREAETSRPSEAVLEIAAVPHDVLLIAATGDYGQAGEQILAAFEAAGARPLPMLLSIDGDPADAGRLRGTVAAALLPLLAERLRETSERLSERERETAESRRQIEWQAFQLRKGRDMVEAIGFDARVLAYELPAGAGTIGFGDGEAPSLVQRLPVDLSGICAVGLHLDECPDADGTLTLAVSRPDLRAAEARVDVDFRALTVGWNEFRFPEAAGPTHGAAILTLAAMRSIDGRAPTFSLSEEDVEDFGLLSSAPNTSLALRVWKGLSPDQFPASAPANATRITRLEAGQLREAACFLEGAAAEAVLRQSGGHGPLVWTDPLGRVLIRGLGDRLSGARLSGILPRHARTLRFTLRSQSGSLAAPIRVGVLISADAARDVEAIRASIADPETTAGTEPRPILADVSDTASFSLDIPPEANGGDRDLLVFIQGSASASGTVMAMERIEVEVERPVLPGRPSPFARRIALPELKSRVNYMSGDGDAARVSASLGFAVLEVSDVENFMQLHPVLGETVGARVRAFLPIGLTRVGAKVGTMHPNGPVAEYSLLIVDRDTGPQGEGFDAGALEDYLEGSGDKPSFVIAESRIALDPGREGEIRLELSQPLDTGADLLCLVRSLSNHASFGWCRWFSLDVEVAPPAAAAVHGRSGPAADPAPA